MGNTIDHFGKSLFILGVFILASSLTSCSNTGKLIPEHTDRPLVDHMYTADPSAHVFNGTLYVYPSHDLDNETQPNHNGDQYDMEDYHVLSYDEKSKKFLDHGQALHINDVPWAKRQMWAPDAAYKNGTYFFYFPARDEQNIFRLGVARSQHPEGPFKANPAPIKNSFSIDPAVFIEDNTAHIIFGGLWGGQLEHWQSGQYNPDAQEPHDNEPALGPYIAKLTDDMQEFATPPQQVVIVDKHGKPILAGDHHKRFFEGAWVHKYQDTYYLSYSTGDTHLIVYATSRNIEGPYTFQGKILDPVLGWTTHHSIVEYQNHWYLFYHDASLSKGIDHKRSVKVAQLFHDKNGVITIVRQ